LDTKEYEEYEEYEEETAHACLFPFHGLMDSSFHRRGLKHTHTHTHTHRTGVSVSASHAETNGLSKVQFHICGGVSINRDVS